MQDQNNPEKTTPNELPIDTGLNNGLIADNTSGRSLNFINCSGCTITINEEGKSAETLRIIASAESAKVNVFLQALSMASKFMQQREEALAADLTKKTTVKRSPAKRSPVKKAVAKKAPAKKRNR